MASKASVWSILMLAVSAPALAQAPAPRPLLVSADAPFVHKNSGITMPVTLAGLRRTQVREFEAPELDVVGTWRRGEDAELSIYVYRSTAGAVPLWFDRAVWAIERRGTFGKPAPAVATAPIRGPGATSDTGLIAGWSVSSGAYKGTAVAILPLGEWLVKLRYSSTTEDGTAAAALLRTAIAGLGWPKAIPDAPPAQPTAACATPLALDGTATSLKADMSGTIAGAFAGLAATSPHTRRTATWCRDAATVPNVGVYHPDGATDRYLIALSDSGRGVVVGPGLDGLIDPKAKPRWSVSLVLPGQTVTFPAQDRLPTPERAMAVLREPVVSTASTWGQERTINLTRPAGK